MLADATGTLVRREHTAETEAAHGGRNSMLYTVRDELLAHLAGVQAPPSDRRGLLMTPPSLRMAPPIAVAGAAEARSALRRHVITNAVLSRDVFHAGGGGTITVDGAYRRFRNADHHDQRVRLYERDGHRQHVSR